VIVINYFQAGGNSRGSSHSSNMGWMSFKKQIDFSHVRKTIRDLVLSSIEDTPCARELKIFYTVLKIENDKIVGRYIGNMKSTKALRWKVKAT